MENELFDYYCTLKESRIVIYPAPWEGTVSYGKGTKNGPEAIRMASSQLDVLLNPYAYMPKIEDAYLDLHTETNINLASEKVISLIESGIKHYQTLGKEVILVGGEHSISLGFLKNLNTRGDTFGILQIDAHMDLRNAYQGYTYSHASVMYEASRLDCVRKIVQVGIRDFAAEEQTYAASTGGQIVTFTDFELRQSQFQGQTWSHQIQEILAHLPERVYVSVDIDGLDPSLCPHTGTPVPGGLQFQEFAALIDALIQSKKKIVGIDLVEVAPGKTEWDANVGARVLALLTQLYGLG